MMNYGTIASTNRNVQVRAIKIIFNVLHVALPYLNLNAVVTMYKYKKHNIDFIYVTFITRLDMTQSTLHTISPYLDHSLTEQQAVTQFSPEAAMSIDLVAGFSGQTLEQRAALSMVSPKPEVGHQSYFTAILCDQHSMKRPASMMKNLSLFLNYEVMSNMLLTADYVVH